MHNGYDVCVSVSYYLLRSYHCRYCIEGVTRSRIPKSRTVGRGRNLSLDCLVQNS